MYHRLDENFLRFLKKKIKVDLESQWFIERRLTSLTSKISLQFQTYVLGHYYAIDNILDILSGNIYCQYHITVVSHIYSFALWHRDLYGSNIL